MFAFGIVTALSLSLFVHVFNALNIPPEGSSSNLWCPGFVLSFRMLHALLKPQVL